jgi:hypothetical protein
VSLSPTAKNSIGGWFTVNELVDYIIRTSNSKGCFVVIVFHLSKS